MRYTLRLDKKELDCIGWHFYGLPEKYRKLEKASGAAFLLLFAAGAAIILGAHIGRYMSGEMSFWDAAIGVAALETIAAGCIYLVFGNHGWNLLRLTDLQYNIRDKIRKAKRHGEG